MSCAAPETQSPIGTKAEIKEERRLQKEMVITQVLKEQKHIHRLYYPIITASTDFCPRTTYGLGARFWTLNFFNKKNRPFIKKNFGLTEFAHVKYVLEGTAAAQAGLQDGDLIKRVNGKDIPPGDGVIEALHDALSTDEDSVVDLAVKRGDVVKLITIRRERVCDYPLIYDPDDMMINAFADGQFVYIPRGIYRFADSDEELALILAHELAHNTMRHIDKKVENRAVAGLIGLAADILVSYGGVDTGGEFADKALELGTEAHSIEFETEADYVGMYMMARAGFKTDHVADFWRRIAIEYDSGSIFATKERSHPTTPERFIAIRKTHDEIEAKKIARDTLIPNSNRFKE